jgi:hypothetical protein
MSLIEARTWKIESWQGSMTKKQSRKDDDIRHFSRLTLFQLLHRRNADVWLKKRPWQWRSRWKTRRDHATMKAEQSLESTKSLEEGTCHTRVTCR